MKPSKQQALSALLISVAMISGCAVVETNGHTRSVSLPAAPGGAARTSTVTSEGLVYSLPRGSVQLVAERKKIAADDVKKAKDAMELTKANAEVSAKALADAKASLKKLGGQLNLAPDAAKAKLTEELAIAQAVVNYAEVVKGADEALASAAKAKYLAVANLLDEWFETASLTLLPVGPDSAARLVADLSHNVTRDDNLKLSVTNGLLTSSAATATDQLPNILLSIAQTIALGKVPGASGPGMSWMQTPRTANAVVSSCSNYSMSVTFDPTSEADTEAKLGLIPKDAGVTVVVGAVRSDAINTANAIAPPVNPACGNRACNGLLYRAPTSVETQIMSRAVAGCDLKSPQVAASSIFVVPDSAYTYLMPTNAGAFTTSKLTYAFKDGMPVDYSIERPSELASITALPVRIAKALISIPAEMLQLRVNHDTQANALIAAKTAEMKAQVDQLAAKEALEAASAGDASDNAPKAE